MTHIWIYATCSSWKMLDAAENEQLERFWLNDIDGYIWSNTFEGIVHISVSYMVLTQGPREYTIARVSALTQNFTGPYNRFIN